MEDYHGRTDKWSADGSEGRLAEIVDLTDDFCNKHLNDEYKEICRELAAAFCQANSAVARGKPASWAGGIGYTAGWVNFLTDANNSPHMRSEDIAKAFGVSMATMQAKSKVIRDTLDLIPLQRQFSPPSMAEENPLDWMAEVSGGSASCAPHMAGKGVSSGHDSVHSRRPGETIEQVAGWLR